jgi:perosamine synthetase
LKSYRQEIARRLDASPSNIHLYWKGRVALYAALQAAGIGAGDEVIVPALTCVAVPNAVLYCRATPVYADVRADTLTLDPASVMSVVTSRTRALIVQNTFGLSADVDSLVAFAHARNITAIEDCTHGFGGRFDDRPNGTLADAAFFSTQWNKPYSTGIGGFLLVNRPELFPALDLVNMARISAAPAELASLWLSLQLRRLLLRDATYWRLLRLYRRLSRAGLVTGSSSAQEIDSIDMPPGFLKNHSHVQAAAGCGGLKYLNQALEKRRHAAHVFRRVLAAHGKWHVGPGHDANHAWLKFPLLGCDGKARQALTAAAERARIRICDWFMSPIHPVDRGFEQWRLDPRTVPTAHAISRKLLTLDTEVAHPDRVCDFIEKHRSLLE